MTEAEWLTATDPAPMLEFVRSNKASDRKFRLFACACCHRIWDLLSDPRSQRAVRVAERLAEGEQADIDGAFQDAYDYANQSRLRPLWRAQGAAIAAVCSIDGFSALDPPRNIHNDRILFTALSTAGHAALAVSATDFPGENCDSKIDRTAKKEERSAQVGLVRDIFGNPFRPVEFPPSLRTATVHAIAQAIYEDRQLPSGIFDGQRVRVLADALEEAGCDSLDILGHFRSDVDHVRGCWAIDLLLQKE